MKKSSASFNGRVIAAIPFIVAGLTLLAMATIYGGNRNRSRSVSVPASPNASVPQPFMGTYDPHAYPCATARHHFTVLTPQVRIIVQVSATVPSNDLTVSLLYGSDPSPVLVAGPEDTGVSSEALLYQPGGGVPPGEYQVQVCETPNPGAVPQTAPFDYNGTFTTDDTGPIGGLPPPKASVIPPAAQDSGPKIGFENFNAPGVLTPVKTTEAGQQANSVEYMGRNAGEPSIGNNWLTDTTIFYSGLETLFVKFDDTCPANGLSSTWANRAAPTQIAVDSDPIGFTDSPLGRSFTGELTLLTPTCKTSYTDNDGSTWVPTQGSGLASGVDHESIGSGRFHDPLNLNPPSPAYPHAVYYCSQEGVPNSGPPSLCSRSDDGGLTFGPSVPLTTPPVNVCGGLHGHVKVSPKDGTVYVPFNTCDGVGSVIVSEDNGMTWTIRHAQNGVVSAAPSASFQDPAVSIDANGRVYFAIANNDTATAVLTSDDHGQSWQNLADVAAVYGLKNIRYPAATAGDAGRAAVAFLGTTTAGDALQPDFKGVWHLYIATTFDGGSHWATTDLTPNAPVQRGCIWAKGGANICRNLLDFFDVTIDKNGRLEVGYVNGCEGGNCVQAPISGGETLPMQGNAYTSTAAIARQSSGRRMFAANDPATQTSRPGMPFVTARRNANIVNLQWSEADTGNLMINSYQILRGIAPGSETLFTTVSGGQIGGAYTDLLASNDTQTYYYKVLAVSTGGTSCGNNEVALPYPGTTCNGLLIHRNEPGNPEANLQANTPPALLIDYVAVGEPPGTSNLLFKMKVKSLGTLPPNSRWRIVWNSYAAQAVAGSDTAQQFYVGMNTNAASAVTFEYGTLADAGAPGVFVITETKHGTPDASSGFQPDGTITIIAPKSAFGNPAPGTLLGGVNGRTLTGDDPNNPERAERSNAFVDHTFVKAQTDNSFPASTYLVNGNSPCLANGIGVRGAVSRKTHGNGVGNRDIDLPLSGNPGIECRIKGGTPGAPADHQVIVTFEAPVTISSVTVTPGPNKTAEVLSTPIITGSDVTINLTNVANQQTLAINLNGVTQGPNTGNVSIPMGILLGDVDSDRNVSGSDVNVVKAKVGASVSADSNYRKDVDIDGNISGSDVNQTKAKVGSGL
ncbi:MAG: hypothetical protein JWO95_1408 [Verrucomicrobiales bacterium]|nr:hypothetical protein [Verrucomicrobiales bacterium]